MKENALFPIFLRLEGRSCLVVGAGLIAESKIENLLGAGAAVRVVAPEATPLIQQCARAGKLVWEQRSFAASDLDGVFLVVSAVSSPVIHASVSLEAASRGVLCNAVDDPEHCDFFYPAVVRRGALQIAISTAGNSPALAQRLRRELEVEFGSAYEAWVEYLGKVRKRLLKKPMAREQRHSLLHRLASRERFERFLHRHSRASKRVARPE